MAFRPRLRSFGPGLLVTAAFVGPGTVATATRAGAEFGFQLAWALLFSVIATIVLQEMSARLGVVARLDLGTAVRRSLVAPWVRWPAALLIVTAIGLGNAAFQTGNILGAAAGLASLTSLSAGTWSWLVGLSAAALLAGGKYRLVERVLVGMVVGMSVLFIATAFIVGADLSQLVRGLVPAMPNGSSLTLIALIGTTVVPYNLFLHAGAVKERLQADDSIDATLGAARTDTVVSITLGGVVTLAIMSTAMAAFFGGDFHFESVGQLATQLEPLCGPAAKWLFALGLFAAGLTSAITAPLAAAYAIGGTLGWGTDIKQPRLRLIWGSVLAIGTVLAATSHQPLLAILIAQAANGILLPVIALFLLWVMNRRELLQDHVNGGLSNVLGVAVVLVAASLGGYQLWKVFGWG